MSILDDEMNDSPAERASKPSAHAADGWRRPLLLAGIGLVLMIGGYKLMDYVPPRTLTPHQAKQERMQTELREMAVKQPEEGLLAERLHQIEPPWRTPPYRIPARLAFYGGLFLFVAAGFLMYRHSPPQKEPEDDT